ncbi:MAG TPA: carbohydrate binding domain-containing protein [Candidatus Eisenbacteria bacterium]|nr:carbohydrate binding domain-containing protein [Candidatus Eisenbacteria bacterium]
MNSPIALLRNAAPRRAARWLPALAALALLAAGPARAQNYPRLGLYGSIMGDGTPYLDATGALNTTTLDQVARYDEVILDASPITDYHPEIVSALRARNPNIRVLAYVLGHSIWLAQNPDSTVHYPTRYYDLVRNLDGFLYNKSGLWFSIANVNLAKKDATGHFVVAEGLADLFKSAILDTHIWDGMFLDVYCEDITWAQTPTDSIDYVRAGYPSLAAFNTAWHAGADTLANRLRRNAGAWPVLVGNCATSAHFNVFNGWMRENFPFQAGGTWYDNLLDPVSGYLPDDSLYVQPAHNYLFTAVAGATWNDANNARKARFGLGSASLGQGYGVFGPSNRSEATAPYHTWWFDEYAVDLTTGHASTALQNVGWLGAALGPTGQMVWVGGNPDAATNPDFETDLSGWYFWNGFGALGSVARDATTAGSGSASAHLQVTVPGLMDWYETFTTTGSIDVIAGQSYAATFWAKASSPRLITIAAAHTSGGGAWDMRTVRIGTGWQRYQVVLIPGGSGTATLQFQVGANAGDVWIDDAHMQLGVTSIWRRDFANGTVLVNPSPYTLTIPMGAGYHRILGTVDPVTNDGSTATQFSVPPSDALFLIHGDMIAPAAIHDLHFSK